MRPCIVSTTKRSANPVMQTLRTCVSPLTKNNLSTYVKWLVPNSPRTFGALFGASPATPPTMERPQRILCMISAFVMIVAVDTCSIMGWTATHPLSLPFEMVTFEKQCPNARTNSVPPATSAIGAASMLNPTGGALVSSCAFFTETPTDILFGL
jgi:hypothetical protein